MVDLFATYFLLSDPKIRPEMITNDMAFGFRETFSGIGIFVFKHGKDTKLIAIENKGDVHVTPNYIQFTYLKSIFKDGTNGCIIDPKIAYGNKFILHMKTIQGELHVTYGSKTRESSHTKCFEDFYMPDLNNRGYFGITARNHNNNNKLKIKDIEVGLIKVSNLDPNFYKHEGG